MALTMDSRITLNDGSKIPVLGLGVWQAAAGKETRKAVSFALESGYRLIDTAKLYGNERDVGVAVRESGIPREDIFITTKLWNSDQGFESALRAFEGSRRELGLDYVDLYLIHWPDRRFRLRWTKSNSIRSCSSVTSSSIVRSIASSWRRTARSPEDTVSSTL
jgi:diketogulonate reductase-like aldo/keto reductase